MGRKAVSQVDFAIASGLFILIFAFLVLFSTNYFSTMKNDATISEKRGFALNLMNDLMGAGEPANWHIYLTTFGNNTAANWSRCLDAETNTTIDIFNSGELAAVNDSKIAYVNNTGGSDVLEATFAYIGIPSNAVIGEPALKILYNTTQFTRSYGEGDYDDDLSYFLNGLEIYLDDWGSGNTENQWIWWNSSGYSARMGSISDANNLVVRVYYKPSSEGICYFDQINFTVNYSYYPYYPRKIGLSADSYKIDVLMNNTIDDFANEKFILNLSDIGFPDADMNSVSIYNDTGYSISCNVSGKIISFSTQINNQTSKWFSIWFTKNSTSNFSSSACNSTISGTDNLTASNRNESVFPAQRKNVIQYSKIYALNRSIYSIMKSLSDQKYDFHLSLKNLSGASIMEYGENIPTRGDVNALQRNVIYQNSSAGINSGFLYIYMW